MPEYPETLIKAHLIKRINRFVAEVSLKNQKIDVYVPNTGRLSELALPGSEVLLSPINSKYKYKILYIINKSFPVMIDSTYSNRLFHELLINKKVPGLEPYKSVKREPVYGSHRFDFLLKFEEMNSFIELKSCILFYKTAGAFPDAVSARASGHIKALAESGKGTLVFFVLSDNIEKFIPNYHTDFTFYQTLKSYRNKIKIKAFTVRYNDKLEIQSLKEIPVIIPDVKPEGIFILIFFNSSDTVNDDGDILIKGFYVYCGTAEENIFKKVASIRKKNGIKTVLHDKLFSELKIISDLPVITKFISAGEVIKTLIENGGAAIDDYNKNHLKPENRLIYFKKNPYEESWLWDMVLEMRFGEYV